MNKTIEERIAELFDKSEKPLDYSTVRAMFKQSGKTEMDVYGFRLPEATTTFQIAIKDISFYQLTATLRVFKKNSRGGYAGKSVPFDSVNLKLFRDKAHAEAYIRYQHDLLLLKIEQCQETSEKNLIFYKDLKLP